MATRYSIQPFPSNIDRDAFGHWLSGFTDGEGYFAARIVRKGTRLSEMRIRYRLTLRADESEIVAQIQSFFGCGVIGVYTTSARPSRLDKPRIEYCISKNADIVRCVIPHFDRHPLRAKKLRDYVLWKRAALLLQHIRIRRAHAGGRNGTGRQQWSPEETAEFMMIDSALKRQRVYNASAVHVPSSPKLPGLFDGLTD